MSARDLIPTSATTTGQDEADLRNQLHAAAQSLKKREPLEATSKRYLMNGLVSTKRPLLPKDKFYRRIGSDLRHRVESFVQQTRGKDPFDRISQRQPLEEEHMRVSFTLRETKKHEQKALLDVTLSALPRRFGMDSVSRRQYVEGIAMGLQNDGLSKSAPVRAGTTTPVNATEKALQKAQLDQQIADAKAREELRQRNYDAEGERKKRDDDLKRMGRAETPQHALFQIYHPIFKRLWDMEFPHLGGTNPFRIVIDRENCANCGAPDYFDVIETPMNLTYIQRKVDGMEYVSLQAFFQDIELMIANALLYNSDTTNPYRMAAEEMKKRYGKIAKKVVHTLQQKQQEARKDTQK
jgi:Bromodomain